MQKTLKFSYFSILCYSKCKVCLKFMNILQQNYETMYMLFKKEVVAYNIRN